MGNLFSGIYIPFVSDLLNKVPSMDFEGQKLAEKLYQWIIILFAVVGFIWGYICQQFIQTVYILGAGVFLACLVIIPPWPIFRKNPLKWQPVQSKDTGGSSQSGSSGGKKKDKSKSS